MLIYVIIIMLLWIIKTLKKCKCEHFEFNLPTRARRPIYDLRGEPIRTYDPTLYTAGGTLEYVPERHRALTPLYKYVANLGEYPRDVLN